MCCVAWRCCGVDGDKLTLKKGKNYGLTAVHLWSHDEQKIANRFVAARIGQTGSVETGVTVRCPSGSGARKRILRI